VKSSIHHIARFAAAAGALLVLVLSGAAQTVPGTRIDNVGVLRFSRADGSVDSLASLTVSSVVEAASYRLGLSKLASRDSVEPGETFVYTIRVTNEGPETLSNIEIADTLSAFVEGLSANPGNLSGGLVRHQIAILHPGASDSVLIVVRVRAATAVGAELTNTAYATSVETGASVVRAQATVAVRSGSGGSGSQPGLTIEKSVSRDTVETGGLVTYTLRVRNTGDVDLTNVMIVDSLSTAVDPVVATSNAGLSGKVVRAIFGSIASFGVGQEDSIRVTVRVRPDVADGLYVQNVAWAMSDQSPAATDTAVIVVRATATLDCRLTVTAAPGMVIGNGIAASVLRAMVTDTLGNPKPDGTPVIFRSTAGTFSNGLDSIVVPSVGGVAVDSLRALIVSNMIVTGRATVTVDDAGACRDTSSVEIIFYPGAVTGIVVNNSTNQPEAGALVQVFASDGTLIGTVRTGDDGSYLVPVPRTDTYEIRIQTLDDFGYPMNTVTTVSVTVPVVGGVPPVRNSIVISGRVFYLVSQKPVAAAGIKVVLTRSASGGGSAADESFRNGRTMIDSTLTDTTGSYTFSGLPVGNQYAVSIDDALLRGSVAVAPLEPGKYVTDVNIPITLNGSLELTKSGPTRAYRRDTVTYTIDIRNLGTLSMTSAVVTDSLDRSMRFVSAVPVPTLVDTTTGVVQWAIGTFDSAASPASVRSFSLRVRYLDTTATGRGLTNTARFTSEQTTDTSVTVSTELFETELVVTKTPARPIVEIGDQAVYTVTVHNGTPAMQVRNVILEDRPPLGFTYLAGSSHHDTVRIADPEIFRAGASLVLRWRLTDSLLAGATRSVTYRMIVGGGAAEGDGVNRAMAFATAPNGVPLRSAEVEARVEVQKGIFTDRGVVVGKIFYDPNRNAYQDPGEEGIKGVELITEDGTRIVTGDDGKYSIPDIAPGEHVIRVREHTIPDRARLHAGYNEFAGDALSRFVSVPSGGIARADFYVDALPEDSVVLTQRYVRFGGLTIRRYVAPRNVVFIDDERQALMKLTGLNFEVGKAILRPEAFPVIAQLAQILRDNPDDRVTIVGHTDASPIRTQEFPNNVVLSLARAEAVKAVLVDHEGIDLRRIETLGRGESMPVADNTTREGRALNRRVEFAFGPMREKPRPRDSVAIMVSIPIHYDGSTALRRITWVDSLDAGLRYVAGSASFGGRTIDPVVDGRRLVWSIDSLSAPFRETLVYQLVTSRPTERVMTLRSSTGRVTVTTADTTLSSTETLTTINQTAIALPGRAFNFVMPSVLFETAKAELRNGAESALEAAAALLRDDPTLLVIVEGHTDARPIKSPEFASNLELSQARAGSIVDLLADRFSIARTRMAAVGFGEHRPIASNQTVDGRQQNRRVELRIFRAEFWTAVLKEGGVDSSSSAGFLVRPEVPSLVEPLVEMRPGERYLAILEASWSGAGRRPMLAAVVDTLPEWFRVDRPTLRTHGIDSVSISSPLLAPMSLSASTARLSFEFEVAPSFPTSGAFVRRFAVMRRYRSGSTSFVTSQPVEIKPGRSL
jgi:uncharacterized repeat protein (TIGR01451 family)